MSEGQKQSRIEELEEVNNRITIERNALKGVEVQLSRQLDEAHQQLQSVKSQTANEQDLRNQISQLRYDCDGYASLVEKMKASENSYIESEKEMRDQITDLLSEVEKLKKDRAKMREKEKDFRSQIAQLQYE